MSEEALEVALLELGLVCDVEVEACQLGYFSGCGRELVLNDVLHLVQPGLLQVVGGLSDRGSLNLLKFVHFHGLRHIWIVNILRSNIVALLADLLLGFYHLVVAGERAETEGSENFVEVVLRDPDHAEVRSCFLLWRWRQVEFPSDQVVLLVRAVFVEDDLVHCLREVSAHLVQ